MGVLNKRNAVLGWAVWGLSKRAAMYKAKQAASPNGGRSKKGLVAGAAALGGAVVLWRRRRASDEPS